MSDEQQAPERARIKIVNRLLERVKPRFYRSGYVEPNGRAVQLFAYPKPIAVNGFVVDEVVAVTQDGVVTNAHVGMVVTEWDALPLEDLRTLEALL